MKRKLMSLLFVLIAAPHFMYGQEFSGEDKEVFEVIIKLFDGMRAGDSSMVSSVFFNDCRMYSNYLDEDGKNVNRPGSLSSFLKAIGTPHEEVWDEKIWNTVVQVQMGVAQVWTDYAFYAGDKFSHCGIDAFHLMKDGDNWKISQIIDTRKKEDCNLPK